MAPGVLYFGGHFVCMVLVSPTLVCTTIPFAFSSLR